MTAKLPLVLTGNTHAEIDQVDKIYGGAVLSDDADNALLIGSDGGVKGLAGGGTATCVGEYLSPGRPHLAPWQGSPCTILRNSRDELFEYYPTATNPNNWVLIGAGAKNDVTVNSQIVPPDTDAPLVSIPTGRDGMILISGNITWAGGGQNGIYISTPAGMAWQQQLTTFLGQHQLSFSFLYSEISGNPLNLQVSNPYDPVAPADLVISFGSFQTIYLS